jgi:cell division transport system permease protein
MRSLVFLMREFIQSLSQNRFLHFTYGAQVTISLMVLGIFFVLLVGAAIVWGKIGQSMEIHVFLSDEVSAQDHLALEETIRQIPHVAAVEYRSKEEALEVFSRSNNTIQLSDLLEDNPLPASYIISADRPANIKGIVERCEGLSGVINIRYGGQALEQYLKVLAILGIICLATMSLLTVFTYSSINNIIALSIYARRTEIRIMQLVGATWWFIRWPFIFEGAFFGIMGALTALIVIWALLLLLGEAVHLSDLDAVLPGMGLNMAGLLLCLAALLLGLGGAVGFFGSLRTVNAFLGRDAELRIEALRIRQAVKG